MINSESRIVMNGSVLYVLPTSSDTCVLNNAVPKTRSRSNLERVLKTPAKDVDVDRRNLVSGLVPMNTTPSPTASAVDALVGPFKTLEDAHKAASLLTLKTVNGDMPAPLKLHENYNGAKSLSMSTRSTVNINNQNLATASNSNTITNKNSKEYKWIQILPRKRRQDHQVCSSAVPDEPKMQADSCTFVTSSKESILPSRGICIADVRSCQENAVSPKTCKLQSEDFSVKIEEFTGTKQHEDRQVCSAIPVASEIPANSCKSLTLSPQVLKLFPAYAKGTVPAEVGNCQENSVVTPKACLTEAVDMAGNKKPPMRKKKNISAITKVASLVFFDLETTGLAHQIGASNVQITEVSMIAINRKEFEQSTFDDLRDIRIIQKICLCTRPRSSVSFGAAAVTGLNDKNLVDQTPFEHGAAEAINCFLSHLPKPVCLLAHNGNNYDFPLLKAEFSRLDMSLPPDILIADTLKAFRALGVPVFPPEKKICKSVKFTKKGHVSYALQNLHLYFFNKNPTGSHSSEGDCIALAKVCHRMKDLILLWFDENCTTFDSVSAMW